MMAERFSVAQAAARIGVSKTTLQRWDRKLAKVGLVPKAGRDRNNWRSYSLADIEKIIEWAQRVSGEDEA